jgi:hypothetical protein
LKFKPYNIYNTNQASKDFIQAFEIHSELLFKHCTCYSGTRGVTLVEMTRKILDEHRTPRCFWADAISTACYISNRIFLCSIFNLTYFELCFGHKPSISHLRPFGCKCFVLKCSNLEFSLAIPLMADLIECLTLRLIPLLSHVM